MVHWRQRADDRALDRAGALWTATTVAHTVPLACTALALAAVAPVLAPAVAPAAIPVGIVLLIHAWAIPELYAARGAKVVRPPRRNPRAGAAETAADQVALGLLGDLVDHRARDLHLRTGLVLERGELGAWLLGEAGALLVRPGGRRVHCFCVRVPDDELPGVDRKANLLLALREDECGFATVANQAFVGARWRVARRLPAPARQALREATEVARRG